MRNHGNDRQRGCFNMTHEEDGTCLLLSHMEWPPKVQIYKESLNTILSLDLEGIPEISCFITSNITYCFVME